MAIYYWAGDAQRAALVVPIGVDEKGTLVCLKSDKLSDSDVKKLKAMTFGDMDLDEIREHLSTSLQTYKQAIAEYKNGRYQTLKEYDV